MFIQQKKAPFLIPFLVEQIFSIIGAVIAIIFLIIKAFSTSEPAESEEYATPIPTDEDALPKGYESIVAISAIILIAISVHTWLVIFTLYKQYSYKGDLENVPNSIATHPYPHPQQISMIGNRATFTHN